MKIRNFRIGDLEKILDFRKRIAAYSFPGVEYNTEFSKKLFLRLHKKDKNLIKVVEEDDNLIGYIAFNTKKTAIGRIGIIHNIFIEDKYRGRGVARALMTEAFDYFSENKIKILNVTVSLCNEKSLLMCKKYGFKEKRLILEKKL